MALAGAPFLMENASGFMPVLRGAAAMATGLFFWLLALGLGWRLLALFGKAGGDISDLRECLRRLLLSTGLGMGVLSAVILTVGSWLGAGPGILFSILLTGVLVVGMEWKGCLKNVKRAFQMLWNRPWKRREAVVFAAVLIAMGTQLPSALTPTLYPDTWRYHFGLPRLFEQMGRVEWIPGFAEANMASNWQMLYLPLLVFGGDLAAQAFNWLALPFVTAAVAVTAGRGAWMAASLTVVSTPVLLEVAGLGNNDLGAASLAISMWLALRGGGKSEVLLAGMLGGFAVGTKYTAALAVLGMTMAWGISVWNAGSSTRTRMAVQLAAGLALGYLPWAVRGLLGAGDPFYPVMSGWLPWGDAEARWVGERYAQEMANYGIQAMGLVRFLAAPWAVTVADHQRFESDPGLVYWAMIPLILWAVLRRPGTRVTAGAAALGWVCWAMGAHVTRFLAPLAPIAAVMVGECWREWRAVSNWKSGWTDAVWAFFLVAGVWQASISISGFSSPGQFWLGGLTREEYLCRHSPLFRMSEWIGKNNYSQKGVLLLGEDAVFLFKKPVKFNGPFNRKWLVDEASKASSASQLALRLRREGVELICLNAARMEGMDRRFGYMRWPDAEAKKRFKAFLEQEASVVHREGPITLFSIRN